MESEGGVATRTRQRMRVSTGGQQAALLNVNSPGAFRAVSGATVNAGVTEEDIHAGYMYKHKLQDRKSILDDTFCDKDFSNGLFNLIMLAGVFWGVQQLANNVTDKGYVLNVDLVASLLGWHNVIISLLLWAVIAANELWVFILHVFLYRGWLSQTVTRIFYAIIQVAFVTAVYFCTFHWNLPPVLAAGTVMQTLVHAMKMHSYFHTNNIMRKMKQAGFVSKDANFYPDNLNLKDFSYYLVAPTLVYEINFPKTPRIRVGYVLFYFGQCALGLFIAFFILDAYMMPNFDLLTGPTTLLGLVRLMLPSMALWCVLFFLVFHCIMNGIAEATMFADRQFYMDWWNATTFEAWYRCWNFKVHEWMQRHIYYDAMRSYHLTKKQAFWLTFIISGVLHEIVMTSAFRLFTRPWLAFSMAMQFIVASFINRFLRNYPNIANLLVWFCLYIGFPIVELMYISGYIKRN